MSGQDGLLDPIPFVLSLSKDAHQSRFCPGPIIAYPWPWFDKLTMSGQGGLLNPLD